MPTQSWPPECIESLERVSNERKGHLRFVLVAGGLSLRTPLGGVVVLVDVLDGEIRNVDVGVETRFERSAYVTEFVPHDASEEWMAFDLNGAKIFAFVAKTVGSIAE